MTQKPFPAGFDFGHYVDTREKTGIVRTHWWFVFDIEGGSWACNYVADEQTTDIVGHGPTPRAAFEQLVKVWTFANGGEESSTLKELLPLFRSIFSTDGEVRPGELMVKE